MAFGIKRDELIRWKQDVSDGKVAFLTHYWIDDRFPGSSSVTKVGCSNLDKLEAWGRQYGLKPEWMDLRGNYPHFDLFGEHQQRIMEAEGMLHQLDRFKKEEA